MPETYRGFCSNTNPDSIDTAVSQFDVIRCDLLNHFHTRLGERAGRPDFGSIIHDLLFDLEDPRTESLIVQDAQRIVNEDPRVELQEIDLDISSDLHSITLNMRLQAVGFSQEEWFSITLGAS